MYVAIWSLHSDDISSTSTVTSDEGNDIFNHKEVFWTELCGLVNLPFKSPRIVFLSNATH